MCKETGLVAERDSWSEWFRSGIKPKMPMVETYKRNRSSNYWRSSKLAEMQCEYILFLESEVERLNAIISK